MNLKLNSLKNAVISLISMFILAFTNLILMKFILINYGADVNGVYATVSQTLSILTLLEAGFALSINVALYKPYSEKNIIEFKSIVKASTYIFSIVSILVFVLGTLFSYFYPMYINTEMNTGEIRWIYFLSVIPMALNYGFIAKYRIMIQVIQKEYLINVINAVFLIVTFGFNMIVIIKGGSITAVVLSSLLANILKFISLYILYKSNYKNFNTKDISPNFKAIRGVGDVLVQKITSVLYTIIPIFFISISIGTIVLSIYVVYSAVFGMIKQIAYTIVNAPQQAFGLKMASDGINEGISEKFKLYQLLVMIVLATFLVPTYSLFYPFIDLYTKGGENINYHHSNLLLLFLIITVLEIIHLPSGIIMNLNGEFKKNRNIQLIAIFIMLIVATIGASFSSIEGILISKLACNIVLFVCEIYYCYKKILKIKINFIINLIVIFIVSSLILNQFFEVIFRSDVINNYVDFIVWGVILLSCSIVYFFIITLIMYKKIIQLVSKPLQINKSFMK